MAKGDKAARKLADTVQFAQTTLLEQVHQAQRRVAELAERLSQAERLLTEALHSASAGAEQVINATVAGLDAMAESVAESAATARTAATGTRRSASSRTRPSSGRRATGGAGPRSTSGTKRPAAGTKRARRTAAPSGGSDGDSTS